MESLWNVMAIPIGDYKVYRKTFLNGVKLQKGRTYSKGNNGGTKASDSRIKNLNFLIKVIFYMDKCI